VQEGESFAEALKREVQDILKNNSVHTRWIQREAYVLNRLYEMFGKI
jgi:hypothetical protein